MTIEDVKQTLPMESGMVVLDLYNNIIAPEDFVKRFEGSSLEHSSLIKHTNSTTGWINQFDKWKNDGVIL